MIEVEASELRAQARAQAAVREMRAMAADSDLLALMYLTASQGGPHGDIATALKADLRSDAALLEHVEHIRALAKQDDYKEDCSKWLSVHDAEVSRADAARPLLVTLSMIQDDELIGLTRAAEPEATPKAPVRASVHPPLLSTPGVRERVGVHGAARAAMPRADGRGSNGSADAGTDADGADGKLKPAPRKPRRNRKRR